MYRVVVEDADHYYRNIYTSNIDGMLDLQLWYTSMGCRYIILNLVRDHYFDSVEGVARLITFLLNIGARGEMTFECYRVENDDRMMMYRIVCINDSSNFLYGIVYEDGKKILVSM